MFAQANRAFLGRAVRHLAAAGIRQFLDIGSGIPTEGNVHEVGGSYLVIGHGTDDGSPARVGPASEMYNRSVATQVRLRSQDEILRFFDGFELVEPGLVYVPLWRPDSPADVPEDPARFWCQAGMGRKP